MMGITLKVLSKSPSAGHISVKVDIMEGVAELMSRWGSKGKPAMLHAIPTVVVVALLYKPIRSCPT